MRSRGRWLCGLALSAGLAWRYWHVLVVHPPTQHVYSDMKLYADAAVKLADPASSLGIEETLIPPGYPLFLAALYRFDRTWGAATIAQLLLSMLVPLLAGLIAREAYGPRTAFIAAGLAGLYFPFIDYAGYFLSEGLVLFLLLLAMWPLQRALNSGGGRASVALAAASGAAWGAAAGVKSAALSAALLCAVCLALAGLRGRLAGGVALAGALLAGLMVALVPLARRCTALGGRPCLIANDWSRNVLIGHCGPVRWVLWTNPYGTQGWRGFSSPSSAERGYADTLELPFESYDSARNLAHAAAWIRAHPVSALRHSVENVRDLFTGKAWPTGEDSSWSRWARASQILFGLGVLLPAAAVVCGRRRRLARLEPGELGTLLLALPLAALAATVFLSIGEARYRVPYDGFLIVLAARAYAGRSRRARVPAA